VRIGAGTPGSRRRRSQAGHAARVALYATLLLGVVYTGCVAVLDQAVAGRFATLVDSRLQERLSDVIDGAPLTISGAEDADEAPVFLWRQGKARGAAPLTPDTPPLPPGSVPANGHPTTIQFEASPFRLDTIREGHSWLIAGQSFAEQDHIEGLLSGGELLAAPVLLLAMFSGALIIGLRALSPVEQSRRRQLEFTADASHELRTPLSVISAETDIALSARRSAAEYRDALTRIQGESRRLRRIVEDMLWLARFDSEPPPPGSEPIDLSTIAEQCALRFRAIAREQSLAVSVPAGGQDSAWISGPPEWMDRLAGVLVDNACRYAGPGGQVRISVTAHSGRVSLIVEDSGPGVPFDERQQLFDRFHRATQQGGGAGLGLAIADSIVRSTGGQWRIDDSPLGGALFCVSWRRPSPSPRDQAATVLSKAPGVRAGDL
jgi:signal transduction histidine kinase